MFEMPCRWYRGGPVGRIRFYEVPSTNSQQTGTNIFWPPNEGDTDFGNVDGPGPATGPTVYTLGDNLRPDLTGQHICGTEDDFAGLTPLPAVIVRPDCTRAPGLRQPMQFRAHGWRTTEPFFPLQVFCGFKSWSPGPCLVWWLRPEELAAHTGGDPVRIWASFSQPPNPAVFLSPNSPPTYADPGVLISSSRLPFFTNNLMALRPFTLKQCSWYLVASGVAAHGIGGPGILGGSIDPPYSFGADYNHIAAFGSHDGVSASPRYPVPLSIFSYQRGVRQAIYRNGNKLNSAPVDPTGVYNVIGFFPSPLRDISPPLPWNCFIIEFILFDCEVSRELDSEILNYLSLKYGIPIGGGTYWSPMYFAPKYFPGVYI